MGLGSKCDKLIIEKERENKKATKKYLVKK